ncbi:MAG TPA: nitroreductase family deazaflavin-dependent oxidoreductase [Jatrophihabitantaceae bacterium]|jgi:deazaflavin-dependent oxidoreductase (nitroreductase family)
MPLPRQVARLNRAGLNRLTRRVAPHLPGFGVVLHQGRRSGRVYETPVNVFATASGFRIALTYGADSDWVKNVLAAGRCRLRTRGHERALTDPHLVHDPARHGVRPFERQILRMLQVSDFLDLTSVPAPD